MGRLWLVGCLMACSPGRDAQTALMLEGLPARGEAQYQMVCARCHGAEGHGVARAPALSSLTALRGDKAIVSAMLLGRGGMSATGVTEQQAADILSWMRQTWGQPAPAPTPR